MTRPSALSDTRLEDLGAGWARALSAGPLPAQESVLGEADALRGGVGDARWRAVLAYRALANRLDDPSAVNLERLAWLLVEDTTYDRTTRRFAERAVAHPHPDVRLRADLVVAACDERAGRLAEAERGLKALLPALRERGDVVEVEAWLHLSRVFATGGREVEALLTARRADALVSRLPDAPPEQAARVELALAASYACLEDWPRLLWAVDRLEAWIPSLRTAEALRARMEAATFRVDAAIGRGDAVAARRRLGELEALASGAGDDVAARCGLARARGRVALAESRPEEALVHLRDAHPDGGASDGGPAVDLEEVTALKRVGDPRARPRAVALLDRLEDVTGGAALSPGARLRLADGLGRLFEGSSSDDDLAGRSFRCAADAALGRLAELERAMQDLTEPDGDDREALAGYRVGFWRRHGQVLGALAQTLGAAARRGERPPWADLSADGMVAVCAWCRSLRAPDGRWLPIGHFVLTVESLTVTHGMCDPCFERMNGEDADARG